MSDHPRMDWSSADVPGTFRLFKQKCQIYFTVKDIKKEMMVNHILLYAGDDGIKLYNSWTLTDTERNDPDVVWGKFQDHIEPKVNFRLQRFYLQKYSQAAGESIDDYITRCTLKAQKCRFSPAEANERLIEQLIIGTTIPEVQKQLLSYDETLTLDKALNIGRTTEASINHMTQLQGVQDNTEVHYVKRAENNGSVRHDGCGYCGRSHQKTDQCPAFGSTCRKCGGRNHWESVCRKQSPRGQGGPHGRSKSRDTRPRRHFDGPSRGQRGRRGRRDSRVHAVGLEREPRDDTADRFEHLSFASLTTHRGSSDARDEVFATLDIQLPSARNGRTADLRVKVDTGAQGNILPLRIFAKMFPEAMTGRHPTPGALLRKSNTVLSAYNGTRIPQYGTIVIACRHDQSAWIDAKFYVADTDGPAILGLPNSRQLRLITLHCAIEKSKLEQTGTGDSDAINSTQTLKQRYPDRFDTLGDFKGKYHIVIDRDVQPVIHAPRKCPIQLKDELPTRPWQVLGTDLFHFNNAEYLIVVDYYSKFPLIRKMPTPCTSHAVVTATAEIFSEHGAPQKVMSDNGPQYDCINYRKFAEEWGFEHVTSSPHFPQSNGFVERNIQSVKRTLLKARESGVNPHKAMLCLRTTPIDHHLPSPGELLYARKMKDDLPIQMRNVLAHRDEIHARLEQRQDTQKLYHDTRAHDLPPLATGQQVRVQDHASGRWKPATVTATCDEPRSYLVEAQNGRILRRNRRHLRTTGSPRRVHFADETAEADDVTSHVQPVQQQAASTASRQRDEGARRADDATHPSYRTRSGRVITQPERLDL